VNCCADPDESNGDEGLLHEWPFADDYVLDLYRRAGVRLTEFRIGPGGDDPPAQALARLDERASAARARGVYVLVGVWDAWVAVHGLNAYGDGCSVTQGAPPERYREWVKRVVEVALRNPNIVLFDGNEQFRCRPSGEWVRGLAGFAREAGYTGLFGSNAEIGAGDFEIHHGFRTVPGGTVLLESDNRDHTPEDWLALKASSGGVTAFWRGPMSMSEWERLLTADEVGGQCEPPPSCPPAAKMGVEAFTCGDPNIPVPYGGGCTLNLTPKFGNPPGRPCNSEHRQVCSSSCGAWRECEPVQPPVVRVTGAVDGFRIQSNNRYLVNVQGVRGPFEVEVCWPSGATAPDGQHIDLSNASCGQLRVP